MRRLCIVVILLFRAAAPCAAEAPALQPGEYLAYRVSWSLLGKAGEIEMSARADGDTRTEISVRTASAGLVRALYAFDGEVRSLFDATDGRLLSATAVTRSRKKSTSASITIDHASSRATYVDHLDARRNVSLPLPASPPTDFATCLVDARAWFSRPGDTRAVAVLFDNQFYDLTLEALRYERVRAEDGPREALLIAPRMDRNPRGLFKRGGSIRVWLDRSPPNLPVRFEVETPAGTAVGLLTDYRPPLARASG